MVQYKHNTIHLKWIESCAYPAQLEAVSRTLGIENWATITPEEFAEKASAFERNGGVEQYTKQSERIKEMLSIGEDAAKTSLPSTLRMQKDGAVRYREGGVDIGALRTGDSFFLYDYNEKTISRAMTRTEANTVMREIRGILQSAATDTDLRSDVARKIEGQTDLARETLAIDAYAKENVPGYDGLNMPNRRAVRMTIRQARAHGIAEAETLVLAKVAAKSGLNIVFDGNIGADGMNINNTIYLDPNASPERLRGKLLIHELDHILVQEKGGVHLITEAFRSMDAAKRDQIIERYGKFYEGKGLNAAQRVNIFSDEVASAYAEDIATDPAIWDYILSEEPSAKEKVLSFFRKSAQEYSFDEGMSAEARRYLRKFKKLFDSLSERNYQGNNTAVTEMANPVVAKDTEESGVRGKDRFSIRDGKVIIDTDRQIFDGVDRKDYGRTVRTYMRLHFRGKEINGTTFTRVGEGEYTASKYSRRQYGQKNGIYDAKMHASTELDNMLRVSEYIGHEDAKHPHEYNGKGYDRYSVQFEIGGENFSGELLVAIDNNDRGIFYDVINIKRTRGTTSEGAVGITDRLTESGTAGSGADSPVSPDAAKKSDGKGARGAIGSEVGEAHTAQNRNADASTTDIISEKSQNVNTNFENSGNKNMPKERFALPETDSEGNRLSEGQREYFEGTKVVDENGNLLRVYHGSPAAFTEFSHRFMSSHGSMEGQGFYFTQSKDMAEGYSKTGGQLLDGYLSIRKPLSDSEVTLTSAEVKRLIQAIDPTGDDVIVNFDSAGGLGYPSKAWYHRALNDAVTSCMNYCDSDSEILANIANSGAGPEIVLRTAKRVLGYDGYIVDGKYDNATIYVAFTSEQFKNADNTAPTENPDIRYALPEESAADRVQGSEDQRYSYKALTGKKDLHIVSLPNAAPMTENGKIDRRAVVSRGRINARSKNNAKNTADAVFVYVPDIDTDIMIRRDGLEHGLTRGDDDTALATMKIGDLLNDSIAVNELSGRTKGARTSEMSYVLLSAGQNKNGSYLVRIIADKTTNTVLDVSTYGLYAVKAKKEGAFFMPEGNEAFGGESHLSPYLRSNISISDFLEKVKTLPLANEVFSKDVSEKLGIKRTEGSLTGDVRYALSESQDAKEKGGMSRGQRAKFVANNTQMRKYSKTDAAATIDSIVGAIEFDEQTYGMKAGLSGKSRSEVISYLFEKLNTTKEGYRAGVALKIADYIIQNATLTEVYNEAALDGDTLQTAIDTVEAIKSYKHRFNLDAVKDEIRYRYDKKAGGTLVGGITKRTQEQSFRIKKHAFDTK